MTIKRHTKEWWDKMLGRKTGRSNDLLCPVGPSSTDYEAWLKSRPELVARFAPPASGLFGPRSFSQIAGYEIWRNAWLACEYQHGIRKEPRT